MAIELFVAKKTATLNKYNNEKSDYYYTNISNTDIFTYY